RTARSPSRAYSGRSEHPEYRDDDRASNLRDPRRAKHQLQERRIDDELPENARRRSGRSRSPSRSRRDNQASNARDSYNTYQAEERRRGGTLPGDGRNRSERTARSPSRAYSGRPDPEYRSDDHASNSRDLRRAKHQPEAIGDPYDTYQSDERGRGRTSPEDGRHRSERTARSPSRAYSGRSEHPEYRGDDRASNLRDPRRAKHQLQERRMDDELPESARRRSGRSRSPSRSRRDNQASNSRDSHDAYQSEERGRGCTLPEGTRHCSQRTARSPSRAYSRHSGYRGDDRASNSRDPRRAKHQPEEIGGDNEWPESAHRHSARSRSPSRAYRGNQASSPRDPHDTYQSDERGRGRTSPEDGRDRLESTARPPSRAYSRHSEYSEYHGDDRASNSRDPRRAKHQPERGEENEPSQSAYRRFEHTTTSRSAYERCDRPEYENGSSSLFRLRARSPSPPPILPDQSHALSDHQSVHTAHMEKLRDIIAYKDQNEMVTYWPELRGEAPDLNIHYFWDFSNVEIQFLDWYIKTIGFPTTKTLSLPALEYLVTRGHSSIGNTNVVTSSSHSLLDWWTSRGATVIRMHKVLDGEGRLGEQAVDEVLQLPMARVIVPIMFEKGNHKAGSPPTSWLGPNPPIIVLVSGDGAAGEFNKPGFLGQIKDALDTGLRVKLWAWRGHIGKEYLESQEKHPELLQVYFFDDYKEQLISCPGCAEGTGG
ncbi:hypothetical protein BOTBODRAFT_174752, partial [Botryobasidium botryosum FD-172 SS1]